MKLTGTGSILRVDDGWMSYGFTFLSTIFQSFRKDGRVNMKGYVQ